MTMGERRRGHRKGSEPLVALRPMWNMCSAGIPESRKGSEPLVALRPVRNTHQLVASLDSGIPAVHMFHTGRSAIFVFLPSTCSTLPFLDSGIPAEHMFHTGRSATSGSLPFLRPLLLSPIVGDVVDVVPARRWPRSRLCSPSTVFFAVKLLVIRSRQLGTLSPIGPIIPDVVGTVPVCC